MAQSQKAKRALGIGVQEIMSTIANVTSVGTSAVLPRAVAVVAPANNVTQNAGSTTPPGTGSGAGSQPILQQSTLQHVDASTGTFVTQYLNNGNVVNQVPSTSVIAYLQAGLTADGLPRVGQKI